eukprot:TRINITY_DN16768_c0_g3_i6.p1 TRINITY_DN16768_c0_g3~~TRINITY_DN16768_c0_g3_i6.p1  ORF type:complete len:279 (-),score=52.58 TRINITY_DN16768_c0_g3_i6:18-854(-)
MGACAGVNGCCGHDARFGEYEFAEIATDPNSHLTFTTNQSNNTALIKHIRAMSKKVALSLGSELPAEAAGRTDFSGALLRLKVLSGHLLAGSELKITPYGLESGHRRKKDGITYFGCKKKSYKKGTRIHHGDIVNDVVIKLKDKNLKDLYRGRHFKITYRANSYWIKDLGVGFGTFMKIDRPLIIQDGYIIMFGDSFLILNLLTDRFIGKKEEEAPRLKVTVYAGPANGEILYSPITPSYFSSAKNNVNIGRVNTLSLIHICRCRRLLTCRSRWSPYH